MFGFVHGALGRSVDRCGRGLTASNWVERRPQALRRLRGRADVRTVAPRFGAGHATAMMTSGVTTAFMLSTLAGLSTGIGESRGDASVCVSRGVRPNAPIAALLELFSFRTFLLTGLLLWYRRTA